MGLFGSSTKRIRPGQWSRRLCSAFPSGTGDRGDRMLKQRGTSRSHAMPKTRKPDPVNSYRATPLQKWCARAEDGLGEGLHPKSRKPLGTNGFWRFTGAGRRPVFLSTVRYSDQLSYAPLSRDPRLSPP